jgi:hypothetical protein
LSAVVEEQLLVIMESENDAKSVMVQDVLLDSHAQNAKDLEFKEE